MTFSAINTWISSGIFLTLVGGIPLYGHLKKVPVYDSFIEGAKEGVTTVVKIIPFLVGMLVAIGMFRASGGVELIATWLAPVLDKIGMPSDVLPLALVRPLSGSAANGVLVDIIHTHGGDALVSKMSAVMMGSTETTFYIVAVYFGSVSVRRTRHAVPAGLIADLVGVIAAISIVNLVF